MAESRFKRNTADQYDEVEIFAPRGVTRAAMDDWASDVNAETGAVVVPRYAVARLTESHGFSKEPFAETDPRSWSYKAPGYAGEPDKRSSQRPAK